MKQYCQIIIDEDTGEVVHCITSDAPLSTDHPHVEMVFDEGAEPRSGRYQRHTFEIDSDEDQMVRAKHLRESLEVDAVTKEPQLKSSNTLKRPQIRNKQQKKDEVIKTRKRKR